MEPLSRVGVGFSVIEQVGFFFPAPVLLPCHPYIKLKKSRSKDGERGGKGEEKEGEKGERRQEKRVGDGSRGEENRTGERTEQKGGGRRQRGEEEGREEKGGL